MAVAAYVPELLQLDQGVPSHAVVTFAVIGFWLTFLLLFFL